MQHKYEYLKAELRDEMRKVPGTADVKKEDWDGFLDQCKELKEEDSDDVIRALNGFKLKAWFIIMNQQQRTRK